MALIPCSECGKEISDKSVMCIQCGRPLSETNKNTTFQQPQQHHPHHQQQSHYQQSVDISRIMEITKLIAGIVGIVVSLIVFYQQYESGILDVFKYVLIENLSAILSLAGMAFAVIIMIGGIIGVIKKSENNGGIIAATFFFIAAIIGFYYIETLGDIKLWPITSLIIGVIYIIASISIPYDKPSASVLVSTSVVVLLFFALMLLGNSDILGITEETEELAPTQEIELNYDEEIVDDFEKIIDDFLEAFFNELKLLHSRDFDKAEEIIKTFLERFYDEAIQFAYIKADEADARTILTASGVASINPSTGEIRMPEAQEILDNIPDGGKNLQPGVYRIHFDGATVMPIRAELHPSDSRSGEHIIVGIVDKKSDSYLVIHILPGGRIGNIVEWEG